MDLTSSPEYRQPTRFPLLLAPVLAMALLALAGCGSAPPAQPDLYYRLAPPTLVGPVGTPVPGVLVVNDLLGRGVLGGRAVVYRTREQPLVAQSYERRFWEVTPAMAFTSALVRAVRAAGVFQFVAVPVERARADWLLSGELQRFEHLPTDQPPRVSAALRLALVRAGTGEPLLGRDYSGDEPLRDDSPTAMVEAFERLSARLIGEAVRDLQAIQPQLRAAAAP